MKMENIHFHVCVSERVLYLPRHSGVWHVFFIAFVPKFPFGRCRRRAAYELEFFASPASWKLIDAELMQNRFLVGFGPSLNT